MAAGDSAALEAERARGAARRLEAKARHAARAADDWEQGAAGERSTADALATLEGQGWRILHDRRAPDGGNIDHVAVGPPGIAIIDSKRWTGNVTITADRRLVISKHDKTPEVDRLERLAEHVRSVAARDGVKVPAGGYLVLVGDDDRDRRPEDLGDIRVLGVERLVPRLAGGRPDLDGPTIAAIADSLEHELPPMDQPVPPSPGATSPAAPDAPDPLVPSAMFEKAHRFYYLTPWRRAGHDRLYLKDRSGTTLGWVDVKTRATTIECGPEDRDFAETLLAASDRTGVAVAPDDLPRVPTKIFGGRFLSRIASLHTSLLIGQEWKGFGHHRMYGTLVDPSVATFPLGWIDLKTGDLRPASEGPLHKDRHDARRYLAYLLHHRPDRRG